MKPSMVVLAVAASLGACVMSGFDTANASDRFATSRVNGIEIVRDPGRVVVLSNPGFLSSANLCGLWNRNRGRLEQLVETLVGSVNRSGRLPKGVTIVRQKARLSSGCAAVASYDPSAININIKLPRNTLLFNVTTPSVFGQYADPRFSIDFDVSASAKIMLPSTIGQGLALGPLAVAVFNVKPDSQNLTGDLAIAVLKVVEYFSGRDFTAEFTKDRLFRFDSIKADLGRFRTALAGLRKTPKVVAGYDPTRKIVALRATTVAKIADPTCIAGYVWRTVRPDDLVCVKPNVRARVRADNKRAAERRINNKVDLAALSRCNRLGGLSVDPKKKKAPTPEQRACRAKAYKIPCKPGYVWREAVTDDYVCVTPQVRQQARDDNRQARKRRVDYGGPVIK
jgi:hypothetical protein